MKWTPYKHQQIALEWLRTHDHAGLFLGMGLGKSIVTLTSLSEHLWDDFTVQKALVIAPLNVAKNVWEQEIDKWDHLKGMRCSKILGSEAERIKALKADADLYIINRENVVWLVDYLKSLKMFQMVIIDELSSFKSYQAKRWKALKKTIQSVKYVVGLTGTPSPNGYLDLWPQIFLLDGGERLEHTIGEYRNRYFTIGAHNGHIVYEYRLRLGSADTINRKLKDLCLSMAGEDWLDLPPIIYNEIPVSMDEKAKQIYTKLEKEMVLPLLGKDVIDIKDVDKMTSAIKGDTAAVLAGKLLQMANGAVYDDEGNVIRIHDAKIEALKEIIELNEGQNILVFYNYQHDKDTILANIKNVSTVSEETVTEWNKGNIPILICHPASAGHGLNLQSGGHICVWYGLNWSLELYQQANKRLHRPGQRESVIIHHIITKDTIDERVMKALKHKDATQEQLLGALKRYLTKENE